MPIYKIKYYGEILPFEFKYVFRVLAVPNLVINQICILEILKILTRIKCLYESILLYKDVCILINLNDPLKAYFSNNNQTICIQHARHKLRTMYFFLLKNPV